MKHRPAFAACVLAALMWACAGAQATVVTATPGNIDARAVTFSPYAAFTTPRVLDAVVDVGTLETGERVDLSFSDPGAAHILGAVPTAFGGNGSWPFDGAFAGLNAASGVMVFSFARSLNFVGGYVNFDPSIDSTVSLLALDENGDALESFVLDNDFNNPSGVGLGRFLGFQRSSADIRFLALANGNIAIDNLTFGTLRVDGQVPEPTSAALVLASLAALVLVRRPRRRR